MDTEERRKKKAESKKRWKEKNPDKAKRLQNEWYQRAKHRVPSLTTERRRERQEKFFSNHPEKKEEYRKMKNIRLSQNPEKKRKYVENKNAKVRGYRVWASNYKLEKGCIDCGYKEYACALHFDHVSGTKKFPISQLRSIDAMKAEIEKCVVRCANCHAVKTWKTGQHSRRSTPE